MQIGNLNLENKLLLAPMADVTDSSFRKICKEHGSGLTFTQMISAKGVIENTFDTLRLLAFNRSEKPVGVQVLGSDPGIIREGVSEIAKFKPDVIDLNSGCPIEKVTKYNMGACILDDKILLGKIVRAMVEGSKGIPISVKIRLGRDKENINILENARIIEDNGASLLIVHTRTRKEKYHEDPDWSWLPKIKKSINIPLVGNGSVFTPQDAVRMLNETGCDSVMIARGALGNPFIFSRFNSLLNSGIDEGSPDVTKVTEVVFKHLQYIKEEYGDIVGIKSAKKHIVWYYRNFKGISEILDRIFSINEFEKLKEFISEFKENSLKGIYGEENFEEINRKFLIKVLFWLPDAELDVKAG